MEEQDNRHRVSRTDEYPREKELFPETGNFAFFDIDGESAADSGPSQTENTRQWESHTKTIEGEFSKASNPEQKLNFSKKFDLDSFPPKEGWLNLDDLEMKTSPSEYPPPERPAPLRDTGSSPSTSGQDDTQWDQQRRAKGKDKEQFLTRISNKRILSYELVEEDVCDDQPEPEDGGRGSRHEPDLIDISSIDLHGGIKDNDRLATELREKADKQLSKVTKAVEEDLSVLFGDTSVPISGTTKNRNNIPAVWSDTSSGKQKPSAAVEEMRERDLKRQREMEEIGKVADEMETEFKRWSAGKVGNIRALLSSLQNILGPEFGWQPIPMKDLLESNNVRKQYKRATLLVHPDKLQQKGATPRQTYIASKVFGLLKDASKKFNSEELV